MTFAIEPWFFHSCLIKLDKRKSEKNEVLRYVTKYGFEKELSAKIVYSPVVSLVTSSIAASTYTG